MAVAQEPKKTGRKPAPKATVVRGVWQSERDEAITEFAPDCIGKDSEFTAYWGDATEDPRRRKRLGYEPVTDETGDQVIVNTSPLWKTSRENSTARIDAPAQMSKEILESRWNAEDSDSRGLGAVAADETNTVYKG